MQLAERSSTKASVQLRIPLGALFVAPAVLLLLSFLIIPVVLVATYSVYTTDPVTGLMQPALTFDNYLRIVESPVYRRVFLRSLEIASVSTLCALLIAYPVGYTLGAVVPRHRQPLLLLLIIVPFWTSYIVRTYGWIGFLQKNGFLDSIVSLVVPGTVELGLLYTRAAVIIGFVHVYLPLLILPIYAACRALDPRLREASADLGAAPWRTFWRVTLPLTLPGVVAGATLFFVAVFGSFVTPQLLGGAGDLMIGNLIADQFGEAFNWPFGAALAIVMTLVVLIALFVLFRLVDVERFYG